MSPTDVKPSSRLVRAAVAEREEIARQRERVQTARAKVLDDLAALDEALAKLDERELLLDRLAPATYPFTVISAAKGAAAHGDANGQASEGGHADEAGREDDAGRANIAGPLMVLRGRTAGSEPARENGGHGGPASRRSSDEAQTELRGPAIRETAVRVLIERGGVEAIHYRAWFELVRDAGYTVVGKDPYAVFLTQISRSPAVRKTTQSGIYALDYDAPARLRHELTRLQTELREVTTGRPDAADLGAIRARREELVSAIGQIERALEEAERMLRPGAGHGESAHDGRRHEHRDDRDAAAG